MDGLLGENEVTKELTYELCDSLNGISVIKTEPGSFLSPQITGVVCYIANGSLCGSVIVILDSSCNYFTVHVCPTLTGATPIFCTIRLLERTTALPWI